MNFILISLTILILLIVIFTIIDKYTALSIYNDINNDDIIKDDKLFIKYSSIKNKLNTIDDFVNLHYFLNEDSKVSVSLFDVNGKKIKSILNNELQLSGDKMIQIDNSGLSKGIYFIKVVVNNKISNLKMLIH